MAQPFLTITKAGTHTLEIKKSKFIANVARVQSEAEATDFLTRIQTEHKKATHNCFAYLLGADDHVQRESDNGEPSGTAGVPILEVLKQEHLHDVAVVVTRYFGGIKLGAGGLIRAYSNATSKVIAAVGTVAIVQHEGLQITVSYKNYDQLTYFLTTHHLEVQNVDFQTEVTVTTSVAQDQLEPLKTALTNHLAGNVTIQSAGPQFVEQPVKRPQA
ncbi:YigZ family protein [Fructilactobacillus myrtifloralis]|uniref:YigZ family protein n=1 Tax=Fructilactobacillus myrtifloralis TaxID=2940301 RepID=A0ABY5BN78_9LACO|nr:YigZ family protein [Fructilactobacillus myrtifloralis]USS84949.1 YigZ family protein [Fructilactobacillus myrtifloralis]